jgi:hypothetical protein
MTEVKSHHAVGWKGAPHWEPRWEVESGIWDDRGMAMTVLVLFSTPSTLSEIVGVTVSPSPQPEQTTGDKLSMLQKYARDFRRQHTTDTEYVSDDSDEEDYNLAIGCLVVT